MSVTLGPWEFDHVLYDEDADVAYLSIGEPRRAVGEETPEGHVALYDEETGEFCGLTLIGVRKAIDEGGTISIPVPVESEALDRLVCA
jgi:uncharacterized protein YuzE